MPNATKATLAEQMAELQARLADIGEEARSLVDDHGADLDEAQMRRLEELEGESTEIGRTYARLERVQRVILNGSPDPNPRRTAPGSGRNTNSPAASGQVGTARSGRRLADMFGPEALTADGWRSRAEFLQCIARGTNDQRLAQMGMTEGAGDSGGYFVPTQFSAAWLDAALELEVVRPRANVMPMQSNSLAIAAFDGSDHSGNIFGVATYWVGEAGTISESTGSTRQVTLNAKKCAAIVDVSNELLADSLGFDRFLAEAMSGALAFEMDEAFINGTGAGKPLGALNASSTISVAAVGSQTAATIVPANVLAMYSRLHPACRQNAIWLAHPSTVTELYRLSAPGQDAVGAASTVFGTSLFVEVGGEAPSQRLLGIPVIFSEHCQALGTVGDIILVDWSKYLVGLRSMVSIDRSVHSGWTTDEVSFRGILRVDGMPAWQSAITPKNGSSMSWCVTLATRS